VLPLSSPTTWRVSSSGPNGFEPKTYEWDGHYFSCNKADRRTAARAGGGGGERQSHHKNFNGHKTFSTPSTDPGIPGRSTLPQFFRPGAPENSHDHAQRGAGPIRTWRGTGGQAVAVTRRRPPAGRLRRDPCFARRPGDHRASPHGRCDRSGKNVRSRKVLGRSLGTPPERLPARASWPLSVVDAAARSSSGLPGDASGTSGARGNDPARYFHCLYDEQPKLKTKKGRGPRRVRPPPLSSAPVRLTPTAPARVFFLPFSPVQSLAALPGLLGPVSRKRQVRFVARPPDTAADQGAQARGCRTWPAPLAVTHHPGPVVIRSHGWGAPNLRRGSRQSETKRACPRRRRRSSVPSDDALAGARRAQSATIAGERSRCAGPTGGGGPAEGPGRRPATPGAGVGRRGSSTIAFCDGAMATDLLLSGARWHYPCVARDSTPVGGPRLRQARNRRARRARETGGEPLAPPPVKAGAVSEDPRCAL